MHITKLTKREADKGIIACSAGNHAQGVALVSNKLGIKSVVCMPKSAPQEQNYSKIEIIYF